MFLSCKFFSFFVYNASDLCVRSKHLPKIANDPSNDVHLCGSWSMEIGELDSFGTTNHNHVLFFPQLKTQFISPYLGI